MTTTLSPGLDAEAAAERLLTEGVAFLEFLSVHLGMELGLYGALEGAGPTTADELADRAGIAPRYAREWMEQQAAAGYLDCPDPADSPDERAFVLPGGVAEALLDDTSEAFVGPLALMAGGTAAVIRELVAAYRTGAGVPYHAYGHEIRHGLGTLNGSSYQHMATWLQAMPDVHERLAAADEPRILDLGCGTGQSALALARVYPRAVVRGVDLDPVSVEEARAAAAAAGLAHRVTFAVADAADVATDEPQDLVTIFEALHDMGDPVGALRATRAVLDDDGTAYVVDERVADEFTTTPDIAERLQFGFSVLHCLPATLAEDPVIAHGTVLRRPTLEAWSRRAGFCEVAVLDIEDPFWQHYRLVPASDR